MAMITPYNVYRVQTVSAFPFEAAAIFSVVINFFVCVFYAFNGRSENSTFSAGQMRAIIVPVLLFIIAVAALLLVVAVSFAIKLVGRKNI